MDNGLKKTLKNVSNGTKYMTDIIKKYNVDERVDNKELLDLLQYHPTKKIIPANIDYLIIRIRPPFNKPALFFKYRDCEIEDDISYVSCIKNLFGKYSEEKNKEENIMYAFRNESHIGTKKEFFISHTDLSDNVFYGVCDHCKIRTDNITTDHFPIPFKTIFEDFIKLENIDIIIIDVYQNESNEIRISNKDIAMKWRIYHDKMASYRLLCGPCNSSFGAYA